MSNHKTEHDMYSKTWTIKSLEDIESNFFYLIVQQKNSNFRKYNIFSREKNKIELKSVILFK